MTQEGNAARIPTHSRGRAEEEEEWLPSSRDDGGGKLDHLDTPGTGDRVAGAGQAHPLPADKAAWARRIQAATLNLPAWRGADSGPALPRDLGPGVTLRDYQVEGFRWMCALHAHGLNGILAGG
jgi:hypothetical protein